MCRGYEDKAAVVFFNMVADSELFLFFFFSFLLTFDSRDEILVFLIPPPHSDNRCNVSIIFGSFHP